MNQENEEIVLGSGDFYGMLFTGTIPDDATIETDDNSFGHTKGGATAEYKPTVYEATDDKNNVLSRIITKEEATLKCGTMSVNLKNVSKMAPSTLTDDTTKHEKVVRIGGKTTLPKYVLRFVHTKDDGTKLRFTMVGNATSGFTFQFNPDKETTLEPTFSALSQNDGTLIEFRDEYIPPILITAINLNKTSASVAVGATSQVTATVVPSNATVSTVQWTSSDPTVATVDQTGLITGVKAGTATITVASTDGSNIHQTVTATITAS